MITNIPEHFRDTVDTMRADHQKILNLLASYGFEIEDYPDLRGQGQPDGVNARAYPIQGVLKYHGMADWEWRTTFLPSISVNNDAGYSLTLVEFSAARTADDVTINGVLGAGARP